MTATFYILVAITLGVYLWLFWDVAHWLPKCFKTREKD